MDETTKTKLKQAFENGSLDFLTRPTGHTALEIFKKDKPPILHPLADAAFAAIELQAPEAIGFLTVDTISNLCYEYLECELG